MHGRLGAPLLAQHGERLEDRLGEAEQVAEHGAIKRMPCVVMVRLVGGEECPVAEGCERLLREAKLARVERTHVEDW